MKVVDRNSLPGPRKHRPNFFTMTLSVADPDQSSGAFLTPRSELGFFRIPNPYF
jgi:hypothetical protein